MAQFRGVLQGNRGEASRLGHKSTGLVAIVNGWKGGVRVVAQWDEEAGDTFDVYATGGSENHYGAGYIGTVDADGNWRTAAQVREAEGIVV